MKMLPARHCGGGLALNALLVLPYATVQRQDRCCYCCLSALARRYRLVLLGHLLPYDGQRRTTKELRTSIQQLARGRDGRPLVRMPTLALALGPISLTSPVETGQAITHEYGEAQTLVH